MSNTSSQLADILSVLCQRLSASGGKAKNAKHKTESKFENILNSFVYRTMYTLHIYMP